MFVFRKILVPVDLSYDDHTPQLLDVVNAMTAGHEAEIHVLYVDQSMIHRSAYPHLHKSTTDVVRVDAEKKIDGHLAKLPERLKGIAWCKTGTAHDQIVKLAKELNADAVVLMAQKPGLSSYFIGSNAERVVRHAPCSVFVIREGACGL